MNADDPIDKGNGPKYRTGLPCIEPGCERPAGTAWSPLWCQPCNAIRLRRVTKQLQDFITDLEAKGKAE